MNSTIEERLARVEELLARTPLNDEMQAAVRMALDGEKWFEDLVSMYVDGEVNNVLDKKIEDAVDKEVDYQLQRWDFDSPIQDAVHTEVRDVIRSHEQDIQDQFNRLEGELREHIESEVSEAEERITQEVQSIVASNVV